MKTPEVDALVEAISDAVIERRLNTYENIVGLVNTYTPAIIQVAEKRGFEGGVDDLSDFINATVTGGRAQFDVDEAFTAWHKEQEEKELLDWERSDCNHEWKDVRNEVVESGEMCMTCGCVRAGNAATEKQVCSTKPDNGKDMLQKNREEADEVD